MHPKVIACSHHVGHWEHGAVGRGENEASASPAPGVAAADELPADRDLPSNVWWSKANGGPGGGVAINDALPINPCPLVGGQNWYDNVCRVRKA